MLRTYVHRSGLRLGWTHVVQRFPNRTKLAVKDRWRRLASEQQLREHALQVQGEHKAWDQEQDEQLRAMKRQGLTDKAIAVRMRRSVRSVETRWSHIADAREKRQVVPFSEAEDRLLIRIAKKRPRLSWQQIAHRLPGRTVPSLQRRLSSLQHSANKRTGKWTRGEQVLVKCYVAAGAKATLTAKRLGTRTPSQVDHHIRKHKSSMPTPWRAEEDQRLRNAVAAAKRLGEGGDDERVWAKETWRWVARHVGRGWFDCLARSDVLRPKAGEWTREKLVELARVMLLPAGERPTDYYVAFQRTKTQCTQKWSDLKRKNPTLLASIIAQATAPTTSSSTSLRQALTSLTPTQRLLYTLAH